MHFKTNGETGKQPGQINFSTTEIIERLIREGMLHPRTTSVNETESTRSALAELSTRSDAVSQSAMALIQELARVCADYENDLVEWRQIQEHFISDTTDPTTKSRIIVTILPHSVLVM